MDQHRRQSLFILVALMLATALAACTENSGSPLGPTLAEPTVDGDVMAATPDSPPETPSSSSPPAPATDEGGNPGGRFTPGRNNNAPFTTSGRRTPDMSHVVRRVAREHPHTLRRSCQRRGGSWEFMDRVVERLRAIDGRWGYNCKRGNCNDLSHDAISYYRGRGRPNGSTNVAIIDIIGRHCGRHPRAIWLDQTSATRRAGTIGRWKYPR